MRFFSDKSRPIHAGHFPVEMLSRQSSVPDLSNTPAFKQLSFDVPDAPTSIINAMREHQAMLDAIRHGNVNKAPAACPDNLQERADHLKAFAYFSDASFAGICSLPNDAILGVPFVNSDVADLSHDLQTRQTKTLASGIDMIMADLKESTRSFTGTTDGHTHALVYLYQHPRDPFDDEVGADWVQDAMAHRACLLASETSIVLANYIRLLGFDALAHTGTSSFVDLNKLAVAAGLATVENGELVNPYIGSRFGIGALTTNFPMALDEPLIPLAEQPKSAFGLAWKVGKGFSKSASNNQPYAKRRFVDGAHPFETLKRVDKTTTFIDEARVARVPKRTDMFARAQFGDLGKQTQAGAAGGHYAKKSAPSMAQRRALGAFVLLQDGGSIEQKVKIDPKVAANLVKATSYFLGVDAVGISRCPDWTWYSHDAAGEVLNPPHDQAISMIIDQGYGTMDGSSGDDWISVALSMRAYLRFSLLGGVIAKQIRNLGYKAKAHTVLDGEVLQPPLLLLSGLGEVSRIGEVVLNPFLGPRLKSGVVTTDLPMVHDKPIDFGLQSFCENCNKCARECPSGAITAGPKLMFNGYEIWKSDSQKCATYRINTEGGAMCGRCMKTCPWNLEGLLADSVFRWTAMKLPGTAKALARLDDYANRGSLNKVKKWWWDLELENDGAYRPTRKPVNERELQKDLHLKYKDQTLAVYPAPLAPHPYPYPFPMDREKGIEAYQAMITAEAYKQHIADGTVDSVAHVYSNADESPVIQVVISRANKQTVDISHYQMKAVDGSELPVWTAGAHLDIVVAPEYLRQYSMCGDPADRSSYEIAVLKEREGRGGSQLMHRIFIEGRKVFVSKPINHFSLVESASKTYLMAGGIGVTPMIAMAHSLFRMGAEFVMHYSGRSRSTMAFIDELAQMAWATHVQLHISDEGNRLDMSSAFSNVEAGAHVYTCGAEAYMSAVMDAAEQAGVSEEARHLEYFSVPEVPDYENHDFTVNLAKTGKSFVVPSDKTAAEVLNENGYNIDVKCSDGLCGVCKCGLVSGEVEHRDFVLSKKQRVNAIILCQSRAAVAGGVIEINL
ncbi:MAG: reductive dehalogenase [bacterium]|jgi:reductive dehalogenase